MKWISRDKIKVDRVACPWLIKNLIDRAEFGFLPRDAEWAKINSGIIFDVPNWELVHHSEDVSFNSILWKYKLLLGEIVRAAGSRPSNPHAAGEGLRWIASGFGVMALRDREMHQREFIVYEALCAKCKRQTSPDGFNKRNE